MMASTVLSQSPTTTQLPSELRSLPSVITFSSRRVSLVVADILPCVTTDDVLLSDVFALLSDAAARGDNVGIDEWPSASHLTQLLSNADVALSFRDVQTGRLQGVLIVKPCFYIRSSSPAVCSLLLWTTADCSPLLSDLLGMAVRVADGSARGRYRGCIVDVFVTCPDRVLALCTAGFHITSCTPLAGRLTGQLDRVGNYIMYRDLSAAADPLTAVVSTPSLDANHTTNRIPDLMAVPSLPIDHRFSDGTEVTIRMLRHDEVPLFYEALRREINANNGYGFDELPNIEHFIDWYVDRFCVIVYQLRRTGEVLGYTGFGPSPFSRSANSVLCDSNAVFLPRTRRTCVTREAFQMHLRFAAEAGFIALCSESAVNNLASVKATLNAGGVITGSIPNGLYFLDRGWVDLVTVYMPLMELKEQQESSKL